MSVDVPDWSTQVLSPQVAQPTLSVASGAIGTTSFTAVAGMHAVGISLAGNKGDWNLLTLKGLTTGNAYLNTNPTQDQQVSYIVPVLGAADLAFQIQAGRTTAQAQALNVTPVAILDTEALVVGGPWQPPVTVYPSRRFAGNFSFTNPASGFADGADVQRSTMAAGATVVFLAATVGTQYQVAFVNIELESTQAGQLTLEQTNGTVLAVFSQGFMGPHVHPPSGTGSVMLIKSGEGLQTRNPGAAQVIADITLQFTFNPLLGS